MKLNNDCKIEAFEIKGGIDVLGKNLEAFLTSDHRVIFSQRGLARSLDIPESTVRYILKSNEFKLFYGGDFQCVKVLTDINPQRISAIPQSDLAVLIKFLADNKKYPIPKSMQDAGFPLILQQSVDEALGVNRSRKEYLDAGATLRQILEYKYSYHEMKNSTFQKGFGVTGLCNINRQVSGLAVPNADERRSLNKNWRKRCSGTETVKITIGDTIFQKAVDASTKSTFKKNFEIATYRTQSIYQIMDQPFS